MEVENKNNKTLSLILKIFYVLIFIGVLFGLYTFLTDKYTVYLVNEEMILNEGDIGQIGLLPKNMDYYDLDNYRFSSNDNDIAFVDPSGLVQGINEGTTKVNVRYKFGLFSKSINIKVEKLDVASINLEKNIEIDKNSTKRIKPIINNDETINANLNYSTDNDKVLKVDSLGNITGLRAGTAKLMVESKNGVKIEATIKVVESEDLIEEIKFTSSNYKLNINETRELTLDVYPSNASTDDIIYKSSNDDVITIDSEGYITAISDGYAVISAVSSNGLVANTVVTCGNKEEYDEEDSIVVSENSLIMYVGEERVLDRQIVPPNSALSNIYLISDDSDIVSVSTGNLIAKKAGETSVNVKSDEDYINYNVKVTVKEIKNESDNIEINNDNNLTLFVNDVIRLSATITPEYTTNKRIKWVSSDNSIASVSNTGIVVGLKRGNVKITAETHNGKKDTINLIVRSVENDLSKGLTGYITDATKVKNLSFSETNIKINEGLKKQLVISSNQEEINPTLATWSSNNSKVVTVNSSGVITAVSNGEATITAKLNNMSATTKINVIEPLLTSFNISSDNCKLKTTSNPNEYVINMKLDETCKIDSNFGENVDNKDILYNVRKEPFGTFAEFFDGVIKPIKLGQTLLSVTPESNINLKKKITLNIIDPNLEKVSIDEDDSLFLQIGDNYKFKAIFEPSNFENKKVLYSIVSGDGSILKGYSEGKIDALSVGRATLYVYPMANPNFGKKIKLEVVNGFINKCTKNKVMQDIDFKSQATNKTRNVKVYECLKNLTYGIQNFAISGDYFYTVQPKHGICKEGSSISINGKTGKCAEFVKGSDDEYLSTYYVGGEIIAKYDRETGRKVSTKFLPIAGHQSFDVTADDQIYINYFAYTFKYFKGYSKIKAKNSGAAYISSISDGIDEKTIYPTVPIKISKKGTISKFTSNYEVGSDSYNKQVMDIARNGMMENNQLAVDEKNNRIAIIDQNTTKNGNKIVYIYKLSDFKKGINTLISKFYLGRICGTKDTPATCAVQGIELSGDYFYTVQDFERNGQRYMNITKIKYSTCPKTDSTTQCSFVENINLNKLKYGKDVPEIEGISIFNNRVYVMYFKMTDNGYKTNLLLVNGF